MSSVRLANLLCAAFLVVGLLSLVERLWWVNSRQSYPSVFIKQEPTMAQDLVGMREKCGTPVEVALADNGMALVRCGFFWPASQVWLVPSSHVHPAFGENR